MDDGVDSREVAQDRLIVWLERSLGLAAGIVLFAMMAITTIDVAGRYFFAAPLPAGYELIQLGMGALVFLILPIVSARNENITVELIPMKRGPRFRRVAAAFSAAVSAGVLMGFGIELWRRGQTFAASAEVTANLQLSLAPFAYFMSVVWFVCAAIVIVAAAARWRSRTSVDPS